MGQTLNINIFWQADNQTDTLTYRKTDCLFYVYFKPDFTHLEQDDPESTEDESMLRKKGSLLLRKKGSEQDTISTEYDDFSPENQDYPVSESGLF